MREGCCVPAVEVVTLGAAAYPLGGKNRVCGHIGSSIVPTKEEKRRRRSRWKLYHAHLGRKEAEAVTLEAASGPLRRKSGGGGTGEGCNGAGWEANRQEGVARK